MRAVIGRSGAGPTQADLWMYDLDCGSESRFTFDASENQSPVWSPDGVSIAFSSNRDGGVQNLYLKNSNGTGKDEPLFQSGTNKFASDWSRDGKFIVFSNQDPKTGSDVWVLPMTPGIPGDCMPMPLVTSEFNESMGQVSPNSRWLAYVSDETGTGGGVTYSRFHRTTQRSWVSCRFSTGGGSQPRWRADGKELFYTAPDRKMMATEVNMTLETFDRSAPQVLFEMRFDFPNLGGFNYSPSANGQRLLMAAEPDGNVNASLTVVVNWQPGSKK